MARPTKYSIDMLNGVYEYIKTYQGINDQMIPSVAGLAVYLNVAKSTLYKWIEDGKNPEFSDALEFLSNNQEVKLINNGLSGSFNATITKLMLSHNHGISENQKEDDTPAPPLVVNFNVKGPESEIKTTNAKP